MLKKYKLWGVIFCLHSQLGKKSQAEKFSISKIIVRLGWYLGLHTFNVGGTDLIPGWGTNPPWHGQKNK